MMAIAAMVQNSGELASFAERVSLARNMALERLLEAQAPDGSWPLPMCFNAMPTAIFIIMLRTTGLIEHPRQMEIEAKLIAGFDRCQNPDGGFWKTEGEASSPALSRICSLSLRLALGELQGSRWPANWSKKNSMLKTCDEGNARNILKRCDSYIGNCSEKESRGVEWDMLGLSAPLMAHANGLESLSSGERVRLAVADRAFRLPGLLGLGRKFLHRCTESMLPAAMILVEGVRAHGSPSRRMLSLASVIENTQDNTGGWAIGSPIAMLNLMALVRAGYSLDSPVIQKAHAWLLREFLQEREEYARFALHISDVCNTGNALDTLLRLRNPVEADSPAGKAIKYLMARQTKDGGHCYGAFVRRDAETDSSAHVLRAFKLAAIASEDDALASRIKEALQRGVGFILQRRHRRGGFSCYKRSCFDGHPGSMGLLEQLLFDKPTPDVSARVIEVLVDSGMDVNSSIIRKTLRFLLRMQCANGSWWSRWWAGYLVGTAYVLRAYGKLGLRLEEGPPPQRDALLRRFQAVAQRGVDFLLAHQNPDGGWGETIKSDFDNAWAGKGTSTPLHTAHIISALLRAGFPAKAPVIQKAMRYLLGQMSPDGRWNDRQAMFTLLARSLYYRYDFLNLILPLDALNDYLRFSSSTISR